MNKEAIIASVANFTNISTDEATLACNNHIDTIQDNDICSAYDFSFLNDFGEINTTPTYTTGSVNVVQDSVSVTGITTAWTTATMAGRLIKFLGSDEYYEIASIVDGTQDMTLTSAYIGTTDTDEQCEPTYTMYKIYYDLPTDFKKMKAAKQLVSPNKLLPISEMTMSNYYPDEFTYSGEIQGYILSGLNSSGTPQIRFYPYQTTRHRIYISYVKKLPTINTTGATSKIPSDKHMLFVYKLNEIIFDMHSMPTRATKESQKFYNMLNQFIKEDKQINKDSVDVMQSAWLCSTLALPHLNPSHYSNR